MDIVVKFKKLTEDAIPFKYTRDGDACMDMYSNEDVVLLPFESRIIKTGIALELPEGYEGLIRGRSGYASKGIFVHTGTVESSYRGDIGVIICNLSGDHFKISKGMRIAQFCPKEVIKVHLISDDNLSKTERGSSGYGSSGM